MPPNRSVDHVHVYFGHVPTQRESLRLRCDERLENIRKAEMVGIRAKGQGTSEAWRLVAPVLQSCLTPNEWVVETSNNRSQCCSYSWLRAAEQVRMAEAATSQG